MNKAVFLIGVYFALFLMVPLSVTAYNPPACYISDQDDCGDPDFDSFARVSIDGHVAPLDYGEGFNLCCLSAFTESDPEQPPTFGLANGSASGEIKQGHVMEPNWDFDSIANFSEFNLAGNLDDIYINVTSTNGSDACQNPYSFCVFRMSGEGGNMGFNSAVADCDVQDQTQRNEYNAVLCATALEDCTNDFDDNGDGFISCGSPACHADPDLNDETPQECTGNSQTTRECVDRIDGFCDGPNDNTYYCSYGENDPEPDGSNQGFCCPSGTYARTTTSLFTGEVTDVECIEFTQCHVPGDINRGECAFDYSSSFEDWYDKDYSGDPDDFCVSRVPDTYDFLDGDDERSSACCPVARYGNQGFYFADENVKTFG